MNLFVLKFLPKLFLPRNASFLAFLDNDIHLVVFQWHESLFLDQSRKQMNPYLNKPLFPNYCCLHLLKSIHMSSNLFGNSVDLFATGHNPNMDSIHNYHLASDTMSKYQNNEATFE